jgi:hypothetical protein
MNIQQWLFRSGSVSDNIYEAEIRLILRSRIFALRLWKLRYRSPFGSLQDTKDDLQSRLSIYVDFAYIPRKD